MSKDNMLERARRYGFTLIELLVVIAVISTLIAMLLPAVQKVRESANQTACKNNQKQLILACLAYESAKGRLPVLYSSRDGWVLQILPYVEQTNLLATYTPYSVSPAVSWSSAVNSTAVANRLPVMECPSSPAPKTTPVGTTAVPLEYARADYVTISGANATAYQQAFGVAPTDSTGAFGGQAAGTATVQGERMSYITDGTSNTAIISECSGRPWPFVASGKQLTSTSDPDYVTTAMGGLFPVTPTLDRLAAITWAGTSHGAWAHNNTYNINTFNTAGTIGSVGTCAVNCSNFRGIYSFHKAGAFAAFADGSVRMLSTNVTAKVLMSIITRKGGETIEDGSAIN